MRNHTEYTEYTEYAENTGFRDRLYSLRAQRPLRAKIKK